MYICAAISFSQHCSQCADSGNESSWMRSPRSLYRRIINIAMEGSLTQILRKRFSPNSNFGPQSSNTDKNSNNDGRTRFGIVIAKDSDDRISICSNWFLPFSVTFLEKMTPNTSTNDTYQRAGTMNRLMIIRVPYKAVFCFFVRFRIRLNLSSSSNSKQKSLTIICFLCIAALRSQIQ